MTVKMLSKTIAVLALAGVMVSAKPVLGQESKPAPPQAPPSLNERYLKAVPLKVTVVIGRFQGEKRTGNLPFVLTVNTGQSEAQVQMGSSVPIPAEEAGKAFTYRHLGTNITASGVDLNDGRYRLNLTVIDNQIFGDSPGGIKGIPAFQNLTMRQDIYLRDGQTAQLGTVTDKASGETIKVDVTLNVIK
jgi:hypothetical protein